MSRIFLSMPFASEFILVADTVRDSALKKSYSIYRTDDEFLSESIPSVIFKNIRKSLVLVADVTGNNPNVLNEVGIAQAMGKPIVLISQDVPEQAPFNIRALRILQYNEQRLEELGDELIKALSEADSPNETLRAMLIPSSLGDATRGLRFVIGASPLSYRRVMGRKGGYKKLRRTSSDHAGIRRIYQAFGLLYGFDALPDTVDPEDCDDSVIRENMNLYCIASPKANRWTQLLLREYADHWVPNLEFRADESSHDLRNVMISLFHDGSPIAPPGWEPNTEGDRYFSDFGVILRGPNPYHENRMVIVIAGRSSLGTEAACTAATDPKAIATIRDRLKGHKVELENHRQPFWAMVSMKRAEGDKKEEGLLESLNVHQVEVFKSK